MASQGTTLFYLLSTVLKGGVVLLLCNQIATEEGRSFAIAATLFYVVGELLNITSTAGSKGALFWITATVVALGSWILVYPAQVPWEWSPPRFLGLIDVSPVSKDQIIRGVTAALVLVFVLGYARIATAKKAAH